jgi:hypothetical protein
MRQALLSGLILLVVAFCAGVAVSSPAVAASMPEVWVHYDYVVEPDGTSFAPDPAGIQMVVDVYRAHGIVLHVDPQHTAIPLSVPYVAAFSEFDSTYCHGQPPTGNWVRFSDLKAEYFHPDGNHDWHYAIFARKNCDPTIPRSGESNGIPASDFALYPGIDEPRNRQTWEPFYTAAHFMHELGHNLGLHHGGAIDLNGKPNYLSVMNYRFTLGIPVAASPRDTRPHTLRLDYSETTLPTLDEASLDERTGLGAGTSDVSTACSADHFCQAVPASGPVDWNGDGLIEPGVSQDINGDFTSCFPLCPPLTGFDDWSEIRADLAQSRQPGPAPPPPSVSGLSPSTGPVTGGTQVTITGSHLNSTTAVSLGEFQATFRVVNDHTVVATTPDVSATEGCARGAGTYDVQVTANGIPSRPSPADQFTYTDVLPHLAPICVVSLDHRFGPRRGGTDVTLTGWGFTGATHVEFLDEAHGFEIDAPSFTVVDDRTIEVRAPPAYGLAEGVAEVDVTNGPDASPPNAPYDEYTYVGGPKDPPPPVVTSVSPGGGPAGGGATVTIKGSGFTGAITVTFGRFPDAAIRAAGFTVVDDNTITATAPAEFTSQTVDVAVFGPGGDSLAVRGDRFTYDAPPQGPPTIASVAPASGPAGGGNTVTVIGSGFTGLTSLQVGMTLLSPGAGVTVVDDHTLTFTAPAGTAGPVDVIARTPVGFSEIAPADAYTYG